MPVLRGLSQARRLKPSDLLETIQSNIEDWDCDKGKESGINYEYDCIKSLAETTNF
jgi:hypothetical protein